MACGAATFDLLSSGTAAAIVFCLLFGGEFSLDCFVFLKLTRLPCTIELGDCCICDGFRGGSGGGPPPRSLVGTFILFAITDNVLMHVRAMLGCRSIGQCLGHQCGAEGV